MLAAQRLGNWVPEVYGINSGICFRAWMAPAHSLLNLGGEGLEAAVEPVANSQEKPLGTSLTCAHLRVGELEPHHYYPRCGIGSAADRLAWVGSAGGPAQGVA